MALYLFRMLQTSPLFWWLFSDLFVPFSTFLFVLPTLDWLVNGEGIAHFSGAELVVHLLDGYLGCLLLLFYFSLLMSIHSYSWGFFYKQPSPAGLGFVSSFLPKSGVPPLLLSSSKVKGFLLPPVPNGCVGVSSLDCDFKEVIWGYPRNMMFKTSSGALLSVRSSKQGKVSHWRFYQGTLLVVVWVAFRGWAAPSYVWMRKGCYGLHFHNEKFASNF